MTVDFSYLRLFFVMALLVGCQRSPAPVDTPDPCRDIDKLSALIAQEIGTTSRGAPRCVFYDREGFEDLLLTLLERDATEKELEVDEIVFAALGLFSKEYDYSRCIKSAYLREAAAFYSPYKKEIILPAWSPVSRATLLHELVHFYQDQQISLTGQPALRGFFHDTALAMGAALEGDAREVARRTLRRHPDLTRDEAPAPFTPLRLPDEECSLPASLRSLFAFQYSAGHHFWQELLSHREGEARHEIRRSTFDEIPMKTAQIIHPQQYRPESKEERLCASAPSSTRYARAVGEAVLREALQRAAGESQVLDAEFGARAAEGLDDDCLTIHSQLLKWETHWSSQAQRDEFLESLSRLQESSFPLLSGEITRSSPRAATFRLLLAPE